jgi:hypothetical protein
MLKVARLLSVLPHIVPARIAQTTRSIEKHHAVANMRNRYVFPLFGDGLSLAATRTVEMNKAAV